MQRLHRSLEMYCCQVSIESRLSRSRRLSLKQLSLESLVLVGVFGPSGWNATDGVPGLILVIDDIVILHSMEAWERRNQRGARPNRYYGQLSDSTGVILIWVERRVTPASMGNMQAFERRKYHLRCKLQGSRSWKTPVGAGAGNYPEIEINKMSNLIRNHITVKIFVLLLFSNYLLPYCRDRSTLQRIGRTAHDLRRYQTPSNATWVNPGNTFLVPDTCRYSSTLEHDVVTSSTYNLSSNFAQGAMQHCLLTSMASISSVYWVVIGRSSSFACRRCGLTNKEVACGLHLSALFLLTIVLWCFMQSVIVFSHRPCKA